MDALSTAHAATDKALDAMEKHVRSIYLRSVREIYKSWQKFFEKESKRIEKLQEDYEKAKAKAFFSKFDAIRYNADKDWFEFNLDYDKFGTKAEGTRTKWTLCTQGNRICTFFANGFNNISNVA